MEEPVGFDDVPPVRVRESRALHPISLENDAPRKSHSVEKKEPQSCIGTVIITELVKQVVHAPAIADTIFGMEVFFLRRRQGNAAALFNEITRMIAKGQSKTATKSRDSGR